MSAFQDDPQGPEGGCGAPAAPTQEPHNRPGLAQLRYRVGTHATLLQRMKADLLRAPQHGRRFSGNRRDPALALLDAWAVVGDVLTFYQERIANEGYLRTATEPRSVRELCRMIGYELRPGVAASAHLAFTVEDAEGPWEGTPSLPTEVEVPAETQVQSLPAQGELPQTFETEAPLRARRSWNAMRPVRSQPQRFAPGPPLAFVGEGGDRSPARQLLLDGSATGLRPGDLLLLHLPGEPHPRPLRALAVLPEGKDTRVVLEGDPAAPLVPPSFHEPGEEAPPPLPRRVDLSLQAAKDHVFPYRFTEPALQGLLREQGWDAGELAAHLAALREQEGDAGRARVFAMRRNASPFGHNAPRYETVPQVKGGPYAQSWEDRAIWEDSQGRPLRPAQDLLHLEFTAPEIAPGGWLVCEANIGGETRHEVFSVHGAFEVSLADFALSSKVTGVVVDRPLPRFPVRRTTVWGHSEELALADLPVIEPIPRGADTLVLDTLVLGLRPGQVVAVRGDRADAAGLVGREICTLRDVSHLRGRTRLRFEEPLRQSYTRESLTVCANVVLATHGESGHEVLGSGDSAEAGQRFTLKRQPLSYLPGPTSTLEVRVGGVRWHEVPTLAGQAGNAPVYAVRHLDDGQVVVQFGDGEHGVRLPSGTENVVARYRTGGGPAGQVAAGSVRLPTAQIAGVRDVENPLPATGASRAETMDGARQGAPRSLQGAGRALSLSDYGAFCANFPGIARARAVLLHLPPAAHAAAETGHEGHLARRRLLHITVAGMDGGAVPRGSALHRALLLALDGARDLLERRRLPVQIDPFEPLHFGLAAQVLVAPDHEEAAVLAAVRGALVAAFSFAARDLAQPVRRAEVIAVIQGVRGVRATHLLHLSAQSPEPGSGGEVEDLGALPTRLHAGLVAPAQMLLINPERIVLSPMPAEVRP